MSASCADGGSARTRSRWSWRRTDRGTARWCIPAAAERRSRCRDDMRLLDVSATVHAPLVLSPVLLQRPL